MKYKCVVVARKGGPENLEVVEYDLRDPRPGEVRIRVLACGVGSTDIFVRRSLDPYVPRRKPFVPGCEVAGVVDALGAGVSRVAVGARVAALAAYGGYAEYIYLGEGFLVPLPDGVDPVKAASIIMEYTSAYQMLHRHAKVKAGDKALVIGAGGAMGRALLDMGGKAGLKLYGLASGSRAGELTKRGVTPIDYRKEDFVKAMLRAEPRGVDFVFDGVAGNYIIRGFSVLRRGGKLITFGNPGFWWAFLGLARVLLMNALPNGKSAYIYGIFWLYFQKGKEPMLEDMAKLFAMLGKGEIDPVIVEKLPFVEGRKANEMLEGGKVNGKIVLVADELLDKPVQ